MSRRQDRERALAGHAFHNQDRESLTFTCHKCGHKVAGAFVAQHIKQCQGETAKCGFCGESIKAEEFVGHTMSCPILKKAMSVAPSKQSKPEPPSPPPESPAAELPQPAASAPSPICPLCQQPIEEADLKARNGHMVALNGQPVRVHKVCPPGK